jgi:CubicO group peptidase (beta-lactamase class C family)
MIIHVVTGQSYETYIREYIFQPLDMQNSFTSKNKAQQNGLAVGYKKWFGIPVASPNLPIVPGSHPAGYLTMSAEDFGHYLIAQLNDGNYHRVSVLSLADIAELHHPDVQVPRTTDFYAMGWEVQQYQDVQVVGHNGAVPGYATGMFIVPEKNLTVALVMNTYSPMLGATFSGHCLRMLPGQEIILSYEFCYMQIVYVLLMVIPFLYIVDIMATQRQSVFLRKNT